MQSFSCKKGILYIIINLNKLITDDLIKTLLLCCKIFNSLLKFSKDLVTLIEVSVQLLTILILLKNLITLLQIKF